MAVELFNDALILYGPYDLSADHNEVKVETKADIHDVTRFGHTTRINHAGLLGLEIEGKGWVQFDDSTTPKAVDGNLFGEIRAAEKVVTVAYDTADGSVCYLGKAVADSYSPALAVGQVGTFEFKQKCAGKFARGRLILPLATRTVTGTGSIYQLGALSATQTLYVNIHVTEFDGSDLDIAIFSNDTNDTVTPTSRATQDDIAAVGSYQLTVAGAITDEYWYATFTFTGTSFKAAISAGIR